MFIIDDLGDDVIRMVQFEYYNSGRPDMVAFMDTVTDKFVELNGTQCWESWSDLFEDATGGPEEEDPNFLLRLKALVPMWFLDAGTGGETNG